MTGKDKPSHENKAPNERLHVDFALKAAQLGVWELDPGTNLVSWDDRCRQLFGLATTNPLPYEQAIRHIHPDDVERVDKAVKWAMNPASDGQYDCQYRTIGIDDGIVRWVRFTGRSYFTDAGAVYQFAGVAQDVTKDALSQQQTEQSEQRFKDVVQEAPFAMAIYRSREFIIDIANETMIRLWGKTRAVVGMKLTDALPEINGQPFISLLQQVYDTGVAYETNEQRADLVVDGRLQSYWFTFTYKPLLDAQGKVYAILNMAVDVTERVLTNRQMAEAEERLQGAVELAELATWSIDPLTGFITYGDRMKEWIGVQEDDRDFDEGMNPIPEVDRERVRLALEQCMLPASEGIYNEEHLIENVRTGQRRMIHAQAKTYFDEQGIPYKMVGTAQDVTEQRRIQLALEQQVQERTEELEATNEELATINEELAATNEELAATNEELASTTEEIGAANEELTEANRNLIRSNQNLEQFAYIASHDLQEPLRKIQQFGDLLKTRYADSAGDELVYLERMQSAASRMSLLIKDLLAFSRISTSQAPQVPVPLAEVVTEALENLSVVIGETHAQIQVGELPVVQGDASQLGQLFQNLLSNALKFSRKYQAGNSVTPHIIIKAKKALSTALPATIRPTRHAPVYAQIEVIDNGIGFDEKYVDRIFQVFQRLHGKNEFAGTGVGLAICQKVVTNHGGAITATSKPGSGATFTVYLPLS